MGGADESGGTASVRIGDAVAGDADAIAAIHVESWRAAYAGILPGAVLLRLDPGALARFYADRIRRRGVVVARRDGAPVGFASASPRPSSLGAGEIETLYVAPDWQDQGIGRGLLRAAARHLSDRGCASAYLWVLESNPHRFFYERLGGRFAGRGTTRVGGTDVPQRAYRWNAIGLLVGDGRP